MAISKSSYEIETTDRDTLSGANVDVGVVGGNAVAGVEALTGWDIDGSDNAINKFFSKIAGKDTETLAGITPQFVEQFTAAMESYIKKVDADIDKLDSANSTIAFAGTDIQKAINNFITGVKNVAKTYTKKLRDAEVQIATSVKAAYEAQDKNTVQELGNDTRTVNNSGV